jgi:large subunit ribosomal protein L28
MSKVCEICGKGSVAGRSYATRGLARRKNGAGVKVTGITRKRFSPNLIKKRIRVKGSVRNARVCTECLRSGRVVLAP